MSAIEQAVGRFVERIAREDVCMHAFELRHRGLVRAEGYYAPFAKGAPHRMYSISKSMVALAVGCLAADGKLSLDEGIAAYFPEYAGKDTSPQLLRLTIRDTLRMATCYRATTYKEGIDRDWAAPFFTARPSHEPGTVFAYDTSATQVLGALCERQSGMGLLDFLTVRVFAPIGAADEKRWLADPSGVAQGGTGLCMSLRDLGKVAQLVMDGGRGIVPAAFLREATGKQIDTPLQGNPEERHGYGYQFWRTRAGWAMYGMGGQLAIGCPQRQLLLCTIADTRLDPYGVQRIYDAFFEEIYDVPIEETQPCRTLSGLRVGELPHDERFAVPLMPAYAMQSSPLRLEVVRFEAGRITLVRDGAMHCFDHVPGTVRQGTLLGTPCLVSSGWYAPGALRLRCHFIGDAPCGMELLLVERDGRLTVQSRRSSGPLTAGYEGFACGQAAP